ncbi:hypothetical protein K456DRAFT_647221 [Colletotrichum gloeosporioides 23]|nr:hypothetical protein K456DRAFT_647221 [Colletotrichum gloeosporioides 23]
MDVGMDAGRVLTYLHRRGGRFWIRSAGQTPQGRRIRLSQLDRARSLRTSRSRRMREPVKGRVPGGGGDGGERRLWQIAAGPVSSGVIAPWRNSRRKHGRRGRALSQVPRVESQMACPGV